MKKLVSIFCILIILCSNLWMDPVVLNAAITKSDSECTVTENTAMGLKVIPGLEGVTMDSYANKGDYILAYGSSEEDKESYLFVLDQGKLIKKYTLEQLLEKTKLKDTECYTIRVQFMNKHFYVMVSAISASYGKSTYNAYCQALVTEDGLTFTRQSMPTYKIPASLEYYPCGMLTQMGVYYIYTPGKYILADSTGKINYYTSKDCKTWTKRTTVKSSGSTTGKYAGNEIVWSLEAATSKGLYFQASSTGWFGVTEHCYVETYVTSNFKTYKKAEGIATKEDMTYVFRELPTYSTNAVVAVQSPYLGYDSSEKEDTCNFLIATSLGKFKEKTQIKITAGEYNWIYGDNKIFVIIAKSDGISYVYRSTDKGENFTRYELGSLSANLFDVRRLLISTDKMAYIAYGEDGIVGSKDGFQTIKKTTIDGKILGSMETDSANYIITDAGVCRLTDDEMDELFQ